MSVRVFVFIYIYMSVYVCVFAYLCQTIHGSGACALPDVILFSENIHTSLLFHRGGGCGRGAWCMSDSPGARRSACSVVVFPGQNNQDID